MPPSDGHPVLFSRGLCCPAHPILLPFPSATPDRALRPSCHVSHASDAGIRGPAKHMEAQEGRVTVQSQDSPRNWLYDQRPCPPLPGPLLPGEEQAGLLAGVAQALSCVSLPSCPQERKAVCVQALCWGLSQTPLNQSSPHRSADEQTEAHRAAASCPSLSVTAQTWARTVRGRSPLTR